MRKNLWTVEEDEFLKENYAELGAKECSIILGRSETSIAHRAIKYELKSSRTNRNKTWSEAEKKILIDNYSRLGLEYCMALLPGRTEMAIYRAASLLKLKNNYIKSSTPTWSHRDYENALLNKEAEAYPLEEYIDSRTPIMHACTEGHEWKARPSNILSGSGCPSCANYGFDTTKPALLYYIKIMDGYKSYYKIGITNRTIVDRFESDKDKDIKVLLEEYYSSGIEARNREQSILNEFKYKRVCVPKLLKSGGNTELFEEDILNLDNKE